MSAASGKILTASCAAAGSALAGDAAIPRDGSGMALGGIHGGCTVTAWLLRVPVFDVASLLLAAIAVCTVAGGALLVGLDHRHMLQLPMSSTVLVYVCVHLYVAVRHLLPPSITSPPTPITHHTLSPTPITHHTLSPTPITHPTPSHTPLPLTTG